MTKDELIEYVNCGREIEFEYHGKQFSITRGELDDDNRISFCEFYKESTEVDTAEELLKIKRYGVTVEEMLASCKEEDICLF